MPPETQTTATTSRSATQPPPKKRLKAALPGRGIIRTRSQTRLLSLQETTPVTHSPKLQSHSEPSPPPLASVSVDHPRTHDHSDIFAIIDSHQISNLSQPSDPNEPKKVRVALMGGKTTSRAGIISPSLSPASSQPTSPTARPLKRVLSRVVSSSSSCGMLGPPPQTSVVQPGQPPLDYQPSIPALNHEPINTSHLVNLFAASHPVTKTYGAQRTFKTDENEMNLLLPLPSTPTSKPDSNKRPWSSSGPVRFMSSSKRFKTQESYNELRKKWGVDQDDELVLDQPELQSIVHQRASGSSKRFVDGLLYLIEGLVPGPNQLSDLISKRLNAIELIRKFKDVKFLDQLRTNGLIERFYNSFRLAGAGDGDPVLDHALLIFISAMCCSGQKFIEPVLRIMPKNSNEVFSMQSDCLQVLANIASRAPLIETSPNMNASAKSSRTSSRSRLQQSQSLTSQIQQVIQESVLNQHLSGPSSPTLLALFSLGRIAMFVPRPGLLPQRLIVQSGAFVSVISCLKVLNEELRDRSKNSDTNQEFSITGKNIDEILKHVGYCMDVIEACTVCYEEESLNLIDSFRDSLATVFCELVEVCHLLARHYETRISMQALDISIGCIRTMVNVTNFNPIWADQLSRLSVLEALCGFLNISRGEFEDFNKKEENRLNPAPHHQKINGSEKLVDSKKSKNKKSINQTKSRPSNESQSQSRSQDGSTESFPDENGHSACVDQAVFDLLCVTLGLLANLVEQSAHAKDILREINLPPPSLTKTAKNISVSKTDQQNTNPHLPNRPPDCNPTGSSGFDELIQLYIHPPCRQSSFVRGLICILINLSLINNQRNNHNVNNSQDIEDEDSDDYQSMNEIKIIESLKKALDQIDLGSYQESEAEDSQKELDQAAEGEEDGRINGIIFKKKNSIIIGFIEDLKLHSSFGSNQNQPDYSGSQNDQHALRRLHQSAATSPTATTTNALDSGLDLRSANVKSSLEASWDRLRVGLI